MSTESALALSAETLKPHQDLSHTAPSWELEPCQPEHVESLEWQCAFTEALVGYTSAMRTAFEFLGKANESLRKRGLGQNKLERALLECFGDAADMATTLAETVRLPLETTRATLAACKDDVRQASVDAACVEQRNKKLGSLTAHGARAWRLKSARDKLDQAMHSSSVSRTRAEDSLRGCILRENDLCCVARKLMLGTAEALHTAVWPLAPPPPPPLCECLKCFGEKHDDAEGRTSTPATAELTEGAASHTSFSSPSESSEMREDQTQGEIEGQGESEGIEEGVPPASERTRGATTSPRSVRSTDSALTARSNFEREVAVKGDPCSDREFTAVPPAFPYDATCVGGELDGCHGD
jgi:hypothetical protein